MSVRYTTYVGSYIEIPECDWYELIKELDIYIDEFRNVPQRPRILISNYIAVNYFDSDIDSQVIDCDSQMKKEAKEIFLEEHAETVKKLKKHFGVAIPIKFGVIGYYS